MLSYSDRWMQSDAHLGTSGQLPFLSDAAALLLKMVQEWLLDFPKSFLLEEKVHCHIT